jgi:hypothetical protein
MQKIIFFTMLLFSQTAAFAQKATLPDHNQWAAPFFNENKKTFDENAAKSYREVMKLSATYVSADKANDEQVLNVISTYTANATYSEIEGVVAGAGTKGISFSSKTQKVMATLWFTCDDGVTQIWLRKGCLNPVAVYAPKKVDPAPVVDTTGTWKPGSPDQKLGRNGCNISIAVGGYNTSAYGRCDGMVTATPTGGVMPYRYTWNNGATTQDLKKICAGTYTVIVTDANGCTASGSSPVFMPDPADTTVIINKEKEIVYRERSGGSAGSWYTPATYNTPATFNWGYVSGPPAACLPAMPVQTYCYTPPAPCCGGYYNPPAPAPVPPAPVPVDPPYHGGEEPRNPRSPGNTGYTGGADEPANPGDYAGGGDNGNQGNGSEPGNPGGGNNDNGYGGGGKMAAPRNLNATAPSADRGMRQPATATSPRGDVKPNADRGLTARPTGPREAVTAAPAVGTGRRKPGQLAVPGRDNAPRATSPSAAKNPLTARPTTPREAVAGNRTPSTSPSGDRGVTRQPATAPVSPRGDVKPTGRTPRIQNDDVAPRATKSPTAPSVAPRGNTGRATGGRSAAPAARAPRQTAAPRQQSAPRQAPAMGPRGGGGGGRTAPMGPRKH